MKKKSPLLLLPIAGMLIGVLTIASVAPNLHVDTAHAEIVFKDRVKETTTSIGTGTLSLGGSVTGYQSFSTIGNGKECYACVYAVDGSGIPTGQWEVFKGTYTSSGSTLSRDTVLSSSTGAAVNFDAGTKHVVLSIPASEAGTIRSKTGDNAEFSLHSTKTGSGFGGNVLRLQQHNGEFFSCVYCVGHDVTGENEGYGAAFGWGNTGGAGLYAGHAYIEPYNISGSDYKPFAIIQTSSAGQLKPFEIDTNGNVIVTATALATTATNGFFRIPSCAGTPTGAAADGSLVRDSANHKVYIRSGGNWIALN